MDTASQTQPQDSTPTSNPIQDLLTLRFPEHRKRVGKVIFGYIAGFYLLLGILGVLEIFDVIELSDPIGYFVLIVFLVTPFVRMFILSKRCRRDFRRLSEEIINSSDDEHVAESVRHGPTIIDGKWEFNIVAETLLSQHVGKTFEILSDDKHARIDECSVEPIATPFPPTRISRQGIWLRNRPKVFSLESLPPNRDHWRVWIPILYIGLSLLFLLSITWASQQKDIYDLFGFEGPGPYLVLIAGLGITRLFWRTEYYLVPGGLLIRKTKPWQKGWQVKVFRRSECVLTYWRRRNVIVITSPDEKTIQRFAKPAEADFILSAWLSPCESPTEAELSDYL